MAPVPAKPGQRVPGAPDCTIVVDSAGMQHSKPLPGAESAKDVASLARRGSSSSGTVLLNDAAKQLDQIAALEAAAAAATPKKVPRPRTYYVDWLRGFLTVLVVLHHCVTAYQSSYAWAGKRGDTALWLLSQLFVGANQAYFMTLFFFLSGLYVPGSYKRKGPWQFLWDRLLRLVVPCIVYSFTAPPFILMWNELAKNPKANAGQALANAYRGWLKPGWPSTYVLPTGPPWFVWMLFCFNVAYVIAKALSSAIPALRRRREDSAQQLTDLPKVQHKGPREPFTTEEMIKYTSIIGAVFFVTCYGVRMLDTFAFNIRPMQFVQRGPFVSFMPDYLPVYLGAFILGIYSGPAGWDVLARLPDSWGSWCLWTSGIWWVLAGWLLNTMLHSWMSMQRGSEAYILTWLLRTFVEQSFAVIWSVGLLVVFRQAYNVKPNWVGLQFINGAYGAYLVHPVIIILFARALMPFFFPSAVVNAVAISPPTVITSWLVACLLRAIPGADRILGAWCVPHSIHLKEGGAWGVGVSSVGWAPHWKVAQ